MTVTGAISVAVQPPVRRLGAQADRLASHLQPRVTAQPGWAAVHSAA